jgi:competence protein ComEC
VPTPAASQLAVCAVGALVAATRGERRARWIVAALSVLAIVALELGIRHEAAPTERLRVSALDVGQGDSLLVDLPSGGAMLIDAGGVPASSLDTGKRVVLPVLRARRRSRLDVVVLSHPHPDHFGGLASTLEEIDVGEIWDTGEAERGDGGFAARAILEAARARGTPVLRPRDLCGAPREVGGATVSVLAPCPDLEEGWSTNDGSLVVKMTYGHRSALFVGDAEHAAEERLLATRWDDLPSDLLKVGHHGSKTSSTPAFVARVAPEWAVISCGVRNRFGHPARSTLDTLAEAGAVVRRTDLGGEWRWTTDGDEVWTSR